MTASSISCCAAAAECCCSDADSYDSAYAVTASTVHDSDRHRTKQPVSATARLDTQPLDDCSCCCNLQDLRIGPTRLSRRHPVLQQPIHPQQQSTRCTVLRWWAGTFGSLPPKIFPADLLPTAFAMSAPVIVLELGFTFPSHLCQDTCRHCRMGANSCSNIRPMEFIAGRELLISTAIVFQRLNVG